jgi:hypothetical protein
LSSPGIAVRRTAFLQNAYVPAISLRWALRSLPDGRDIRAFTPVVDGLCPAMTEAL